MLSMTSETAQTQIYERRLPAPDAIRGVLALHAPNDFDLACLVSGYILTDHIDPPRSPASLTNTEGTDTDTDALTVRDVVRASPTRAYVLLSGTWMGWWRIDTGSVPMPKRSEVLGELTPVPDARSFTIIRSSDLRIDDLIYASGLPNGIEARILDVIAVHSDGRGPSLLLRTEFGWFIWRRAFAHVAAL